MGDTAMAINGCNSTVAVLSYKFWQHPRAKRIARTLVSAGFSVRVWGTSEVVRSGPRILKGILNYLYDAISVYLLKADLYWIENIPDIVYLPLAIGGRKYVYDRRSPWVLELVVEFPFLARFARLLTALERFMIKKACCITVVTKSMLKEFAFDGLEKYVEVIPNYPESSFECNRDKNLRRELGISDDTPVFLFLGKLSLVEGADLLVRTAIALKDTGAELWIVGDGPARGLIERVAEKYRHVRWFGWVDRTEVPRYIGSADYGLVPRRRRPASVFYSHENVLKIGEYLRCGLPVIASGIAPSPFYLLVDEREFPLVVRKVALGLINVPKPPPVPLWEEESEPKIVSIAKQCLSK